MATTTAPTTVTANFYTEMDEDGDDIRIPSDTPNIGRLMMETLEDCGCLTATYDLEDCGGVVAIVVRRCDDYAADGLDGVICTGYPIQRQNDGPLKVVVR